MAPLRIVIIGQSAFGAEVYKSLLNTEHTIVCVYSIPDVNGREDALASAAKENGHPVFKFSQWKAPKKEGGKVLPSVFEQYCSLKADLNVLAFVTSFIPMEISNACTFGSIIYHPSLLPRHRGASAINWTLMAGDKKTGLTVFWADDGLDTGPILLQKECDVLPDDTVNSLYKRFLFPEGVKAMVESVNLIAEGKAPKITQNEEEATYEPIWKDRTKAKVNFDQTAASIHDFIRGNDRVPGAWCVIAGLEVTLYGSHLIQAGEKVTSGEILTVDGLKFPGSLSSEGLILTGNDEGKVKISSVKVQGKVLSAAEFLNDFILVKSG